MNRMSVNTPTIITPSLMALSNVSTESTVTVTTHAKGNKQAYMAYSDTFQVHPAVLP